MKKGQGRDEGIEDIGKSKKGRKKVTQKERCKKEGEKEREKETKKTENDDGAYIKRNKKEGRKNMRARQQNEKNARKVQTFGSAHQLP